MFPFFLLFKDVRLVEFMYLVFTRMPGGVTVGDSCLRCCVPCLSGDIYLLCLVPQVALQLRQDPPLARWFHLGYTQRVIKMKCTKFKLIPKIKNIYKIELGFPNAG